MAARHLSMAQLKRTPEWQALSVQQRFWLESYIESGRDKTFATKCAYDGPPSHARTMGYYVLKNRKVQAALACYKGARQVFLERLQADFEKARPGSAAGAKLQALIAELAFEVKPKKLKHSKKSKRRKSS